ncbi:MAG: MerR family transcriptional regulator [Pseudomonadota bacterium]
MVSPERGESVARRPGTRPVKSAAAFRTISEVADELDVAQHVLRFWESKFPQVRPLKRGGGRRYYRPEDVDLLRQIRSLLYEEGYTIRGAQKLLKGQRRATADSENGETAVPALAESQSGVSSGARLSEAGEAAPQLPLERTDAGGDVRERLMGLRAELVALRKALRDVIG